MALTSYIETIVARYGMTFTQEVNLSVGGIGAPTQSFLNIDGGDTVTLVQNVDEIVMDLVTSDVPGLRHWFLTWLVPGPATVRMALGMTLSGSNLGKSSPMMNMFTNVIPVDPFIFGVNDNRVAWTVAGAKEVVAGVRKPVSVPTGLPNPEDQQTYESYLKINNHEHNVAFIDTGADIHVGGHHGRRVRNPHDMLWPSGLPSSVVSYGFGITVPPSRSGRLVCSAPIYVAID